MSRAILALVAQVSFLGVASADERGAPHWTYDGAHGPSHWSTLDAAYRACRTGTHQSPIDIEGEVAAELPAIEFRYAPSPLRIVDNGHTVQATYEPGSSISAGGARYELRQLHFHHPAEETVHGRSYPLEAHLVHASPDGRLAVVAVMVAEGAANETIGALWTHLPSEPEKEMSPAGIAVDAGRLLPGDRGYYTFEGSLTTPPCTEGVTWFVLKNVVEASKAQIGAFAARYPHNARPVQGRHGRVIRTTR